MKRGAFLEHVGWTGAGGIAYTLTAGGVFSAATPAGAAEPLTFVQISDSHIGFNKPANDHVAATLERSVRMINALPRQPAFVVHTGDVTHLSTPEQFDTARQILSGLRAPAIVLPGEHDVIGDDGKAFGRVFGRRDAPRGWYAFDRGGVHFVALVNVLNESMGKLGSDQLAWLRDDLAGRPADTPLVVFGHVPLYALYPSWGWSTDDGAEALALLARFDAVTVLNGHIHQVIRHREGNVTFATAASTAYPQPAPGAAAAPGPLTLPPDHLLAALGYRSVTFAAGPPAVVDVALG